MSIQRLLASQGRDSIAIYRASYALGIYCAFLIFRYTYEMGLFLFDVFTYSLYPLSFMVEREKIVRIQAEDFGAVQLGYSQQ